MTVANPIPDLTSGRLLARNTVWNLLGQLLPMAVAFVAVPPLVRSLGIERFGLLSMAWIIIGYLSLFDLGMGRALTKLVADKLGSNEAHLVPPLAWTALLLMFALGLVGSLLISAAVPLLVDRILKIPGWLQAETVHSFYLLAISIPIVTVTSGLRGILEAQQQFRILSLIRVPTSIFSFVGPLLVLPISHSLTAVVLVLIAGRIIGCIAHVWACLRAMPILQDHLVVDLTVVSPVIRIGGWMTVSNIVGPLMVYLDRFLIGALLSVSAVAYYTAPFDVVTRLSIIPAALGGVLFPAFAVSLLQDRARTISMYRGGSKCLLLVVFPIVLAIVAFAPEGLRLWLGPAFAERSTAVARWLAAGVLINSLAQVSYSLIQSADRADFTAKLHLAELPLYLVTLLFLTRHFGIEGAAFAWFARVVIDMVALFYFAHRLLFDKSNFPGRLVLSILCSLLCLWVLTLPQDLIARVWLFLLCTAAFTAAGWFWIMGAQERAVILRWCEATRIVSRAQENQ